MKEKQFGLQVFKTPKPTFRQKPIHKRGFGVCDSCDVPLGITGGYANTGLCGPCCTGESETITERGDTW